MFSAHSVRWVNAPPPETSSPPPLPPEHPTSLRAVGLRGEVGLDTDDRLDRGSSARFVELVRTEGVAVVGDRDGRHAHPLATGEKVSDSGRTVEHRILRVHVQVDERTVPRLDAPRHIRTNLQIVFLLHTGKVSKRLH